MDEMRKEELLTEGIATKLNELTARRSCRTLGLVRIPNPRIAQISKLVRYICLLSLFSSLIPNLNLNSDSVFKRDREAVAEICFDFTFSCSPIHPRPP